jgi:hypothetical protein
MNKENVWQNADGCYGFHLDSDVRDVVCDITEEGAADGLSDQEIADQINAYLAAKYWSALN